MLIRIFFTINSLCCYWTSDSRNVSVNTYRLAKQCQMSAPSFENSVPSHKNDGENKIANRGCLSKQWATSALWIESIIIPNANDSKNRGGLAKYCPKNPLSVENGRCLTKYIKSRHGTSIDTPQLKQSNQCVTG